MRQIHNIYKKELVEANKEKDKKYVVSRKFKSAGNKTPKGVKFVDSRMKKEKRAMKRVNMERKNRGGKSRKRQIKRHKGKKKQKAD